MNYIKKLTLFFNKAAADDGLSPTQLSLFMALFQLWNQARFPDFIQITRDDVMRLSKINSKATYHKAIGYLHQNHYIHYLPSFNPLKGSKITFFPDPNADSESINKPVQILNTRPINEPFNKLYSTTIIQDNSSTSLTRERDDAENSIFINAKNELLKKEKSSAKKEKEIPPITQLVQEFFEQNGASQHEADRFINHYTANGWLVGGKSPMKDWKASAKNWISNTNKFNQNANQVKPSRAQQLHSSTNKNYFEPL